MATYVTRFKSGDSGAATCTGEVGSLVGILDRTLVIHSVFSTADDAAFNTNTTEARLDGGTPFTLWPTPGTSDRTYIGMQVPWSRLVVDVATASSGQTTIYEYWNGSSWATLSVTDGTSGLTQDGSLTWTAPGDWATVSVNSVTLYWIRIRFSGSAPGTNPTINSLSYLGWLVAYSGTNKRAYKMGAGTGLYLRVNDSGAGSGDESGGTPNAQEARLRGYRTMSTVDAGTTPFPSVAQAANGGFARKSATANSTARTWELLADDRGLYFRCLTGDVAANYYSWHFGDLYSFVTSDTGQCLLIARGGENSGTAGNDHLAHTVTTIASQNTMHYLAGDYTNTAASTQVGKAGDQAAAVNSNDLRGGLRAAVSAGGYNPADGGIHLARIYVYEITGATQTRRGYLRGMWHFLNLATESTFTDLDTFTGVGELTGRSFLLHKYLGGNTSNVVSGCFETSDTWDTN